MNWLSGIKAGVKAIFGGSSDGASNVMKVATGVGNWIDEQKFTEQEKAKYSVEMLGHYSNFMESTVAENTQRSITRRSIAIWVIRTEIGFLTASALLYKFEPDLAKYLYQIATDSPMGYLTLGVGAFFFGAHLIRQLPSNKKVAK